MRSLLHGAGLRLGPYYDGLKSSRRRVGRGILLFHGHEPVEGKKSRPQLRALADVMLWRGIPEHIRSDNGPEFVAKDLRKWLRQVGTGSLYIEPGSPWENGYCERFNGKLGDECLNGEIFYSLKEAQVVIDHWRVEYNTRRPHSALGYRPPAPATCEIGGGIGYGKDAPKQRGLENAARSPLFRSLGDGGSSSSADHASRTAADQQPRL